MESRSCIHCPAPRADGDMLYCPEHAELYNPKPCEACKSGFVFGTGTLCPACKCFTCERPAEPAGALHCRQCERWSRVRAIERFVRTAWLNPMFAAAVFLRWSMTGMAAAIGAQAGPLGAAVCAVVALEVSGWMSVKILTGGDDDQKPPMA